MLFFFSYFAAVPKADIARSGQLVAALFFRNVFGDHAAVKVLPVLIARELLFFHISTFFVPKILWPYVVSALGNMYAVRGSYKNCSIRFPY